MKNKKILLISSPFEDALRFPTPLDKVNYPLGIAYIHSSLERNGYCVRTEFCNNDTYKHYFIKLKNNLKSFSPDIVCFNVLTMNRVTTFKSIDMLNKEFPNVKIILGGIHASILYEQILNKYPFVFIIVGEGELTLPELIENMNNPLNLRNIKGFAFFDGKQIVMNSSELIENLDQLPFPKHELFFNEKRTQAYIISSRGCPFKCNFCCLHTISKRKYRVRSIKNVIAEIDYLVEKYPQIKTLEFSDDTLLLDINRAKMLMNELIKKRYNLVFRASARFKPFDLELAKLMEKAGFKTLMFGLETGSKKILESIHKGITHEDVLKTWKILAQTKIKPVPFFIVGFPGETEETINESIIFLKKMKKIKHFWLYDIGILWVYPNTEVYEIMKKEGVINDNYWMSDKDVPQYTVEHNRSELVRFKNKIIFGSMNYLDLLRFIISIMLVRVTKREGPRFIKEKLYIPIIKKLLFLM